MHLAGLSEVRASSRCQAARHTQGKRIPVLILALAWLVLFASPTFAGSGKVFGKVAYEKVAYRTKDGTKLGLQVDNPEIMPVLGARVQLRSMANGKVLGVPVYTDPSGAYEIPWQVDQKTQAYVEVLAASSHVVVVNNQQPPQNYRLVSPPFVLDAADIRLESPLVAKDSDRIAGAFNILECLRRADDFLQKEGGVTRQELDKHQITVRWTAGFNGPPGQNWTTHFSEKDKSAFIYGDRNVDSDEFDDCIILHEYGHFVMSVFSSVQDTPAGHHHPGCKLDPRLAWSEGWANFFSAAVRNDPLYVDTIVRGGKPLVTGHNLDDIRQASFQKRRRSYDIARFGGYWDEHTVGTTLWALFDGRRERPAGHLGLGFRPIWEVVSQALSDRRHVTLIEFCDLLVERNKHDKELLKGLTQVLAARNIAYTPGGVPSVKNPYQRPLAFGVVQEGAVNSLLGLGAPDVNDRYFHFKSSAIYTFVLDRKAKVKIHMEITDSDTPETADLDLWLYHKRNTVAVSQVVNGVGDTETIEKELEPGLYYVEVKAFGGSSGSYRLQATVVGEQQQRAPGSHRKE